MMVLPHGRILTIGRTGDPQVWDPAAGTFTAVPSPARLFCAGHALLADGRVLVAGGHISDGHGFRTSPISRRRSGVDVGSTDGSRSLVSDVDGDGQR